MNKKPMMIGLIVHLIIFKMFIDSNLYLFHIGFETTIKSFYCFSTLNLVFTNFINYKKYLKLVTQLSYRGRTGMEAVRTAGVNTQCKYVGLEQY